MLFVACGPPSDYPEIAPSEDRVAPSLLERAAAGSAVFALIEMEEPAIGIAQGALSNAPEAWADESLVLRQRALAEVKDSVFAELAQQVPGGLRLKQDYGHLPMVGADVRSLEALKALAADPRVRRVHAEQTFEATLTESLALIRQPEVAAAGKTGSGVSVAVLDTGTDYRKAAFGSCTSPGVPAGCKVAYANDFAPSDGSLDDHGHGTNVAGIVLGVAPDAQVLALDVFRGQYAYSSDILAAINWCIENKAQYRIAAINLSLGGEASTTPCSADAFASSVAAARSAGILSAIASGNNGYTDRISSPGCTPAAVSVGAVYDSNQGSRGWSLCSDATTAADKVTCFSNSASFLSILAPGSVISAAEISMSGTSQATPHVAGALAVLAAAFPSETAAERLARLLTSGTTVTDARNGVSKPRLDLLAASAGCAYAVSPASDSAPSAGATRTYAVTTGSGCSWVASSSDTWAVIRSGSSGTGSGTVTVSVLPNAGAQRSTSLSIAGKAVTLTQNQDAAVPSGSVAIQGNAAATASRGVTLTLSGVDNVAVSQVCVSNSTQCSAWRGFVNSMSWTLTPGEGTKTVYAWFRDAAGNVSPAAQDSILVDTKPPTGGAMTAAARDASVSLSWTGFADTGSGIASYRVVYATAKPPTNCNTGTLGYEGSGSAATISGLTNGRTYGFRACAVDAVGNMSTGVTVTAKPAPEYDAPTGSLTLAGGAAWTRSGSISVRLQAVDASPVTSMCLSNTSRCGTWVSYSATSTWALAPGAGPRTVTAWLRDAWGNTSAPMTASIQLDSLPPSTGVLAAVGGPSRIVLSWSGIIDLQSGVASYTLVFADGARPPLNCSSGTVLVHGLATSYTHTGRTAKAKVSYRLCATDALGNTSRGVVTTVSATQ